jgi:hypothetical protein
MNPIPTTNAMKPAAGKGIPSFPTPVIKDTVIVEVVNAWKGDYVPLEYGAKWDDYPHASQQGSYPDHKLISQSPNSEDGQWVKRIWANDRVDQDTYNYAIKYSAGSDAHPIYIRTYLEPRDTYAPRLDNSPDPLFPSAVLVDEEVTRTEGEFDSRYVQVTRVYETLPGPVVPTKRINERGDLETINTQTVAPGTQPDPDGLLVTQTQVAQEEVSKGVKTTATVPSHSQLLIKEKKEGLLGETVTTDNIVDPSTSPDNLSTTVVASVVQQTSATKAVKRTTTASGPTSLTQKSKDGKLLGDVTITESVVAPNTNPDTPTGVQTGILSSEVRQVDIGKAIKKNTSLNSTPTLLGSERKAGLLGDTSIIETVVAAGTAADDLTQSIVTSSVEPIDTTRSRKVTQISSGPTSLAGKEKKEGLLGETTVTRSIVVAGAEPDQLSQSVIASTVTPIDGAKSEKTTVVSTGPTSLTGRQSKEGLLGMVTIEEKIVSSGAQPDALSLTTLSSEVSPIDSAKAKKTTVTSLGPTSLQTTSLVDSQLGLVEANVKQSIVGNNINSSGSLLKTKDTIDPIDESKSKREEVVVLNWPIVSGVDYDETLGLPIQYTETIVSPSEYDTTSEWTNISNIEYKPIDKWKSLKRRYNKDEIVKALSAQFYSLETQLNISLPDTLQQVVVYTAGGGSNGRNISNTVSSGGDSYSYEKSGGYSGGSSISADVYFKIKKGFNGYVKGKQHIFFMPIELDGSIKRSVLDELNDKDKFNTYQEWPLIRQTSENIVVITSSSSYSVSEGESNSVSLNGFSNSERSDKSGSYSSNANSIVIPETLHGDLPILKSTGSSLPSEFEGDTFVYPSQLTATTPPVFPTGKFLISSQMELYKWGMVKVTAITAEITEQYV